MKENRAWKWYPGLLSYLLKPPGYRHDFVDKVECTEHGAGSVAIVLQEFDFFLLRLSYMRKLFFALASRQAKHTLAVIVLLLAAFRQLTPLFGFDDDRIHASLPDIKFYFVPPILLLEVISRDLPLNGLHHLAMRHKRDDQRVRRRLEDVLERTLYPSPCIPVRFRSSGIRRLEQIIRIDIHSVKAGELVRDPVRVMPLIPFQAFEPLTEAFEHNRADGGDDWHETRPGGFQSTEKWRGHDRLWRRKARCAVIAYRVLETRA